MTQREVKEMVIGITPEKTIALCRRSKNGKLIPVRPITGEESAAITAMMYAMFRAIHPEQNVMPIPFGQGTALAITEIETQKQP